MKNQRKIYEALLAGETLDCYDELLKLNESGFVVNEEGNRFNAEFSCPHLCEIHKKWYENIPEGGVLCLVAGKLETVIGYDEDFASSYKFKLSDSLWCSEPTPLTKQEIQVFMDNAPEEV